MSDRAPRSVVGCDVVAVARMRTLLAERPGARDRLFTARECADVLRGGVDTESDVAIERLAARFAAKEATRKALGGRGPSLTTLEVRTGTDGAPSLWVDDRPLPLACSLSHDAGVAMAVVVGDRDEVETALAAHG